jgi:hypothetical protein
MVGKLSKFVAVIGLALLLCVATVSISGCTITRSNEQYYSGGSSSGWDTTQVVFSFIADYPYKDVNASSISLMHPELDQCSHTSGKTTVTHESVSFNDIYFEEMDGTPHTATICISDAEIVIAIMDGKINMFTGKPFVR